MLFLHQQFISYNDFDAFVLFVRFPSQWYLPITCFVSKYTGSPVLSLIGIINSVSEQNHACSVYEVMLIIRDGSL